jgi:hypothetical protein
MGAIATLTRISVYVGERGTKSLKPDDNHLHAPEADAAAV